MSQVIASKRIHNFSPQRSCITLRKKIRTTE